MKPKKYKFPKDERKRCIQTKKGMIHHPECPNKKLIGEFPECCRLYTDIWYEGKDEWTYEKGKFVCLSQMLKSKGRR